MPRLGKGARNFNMYVIDQSGKVRTSEDVELADKIMETKRDKGLWPTIDLLLKVWKEKTPDEVKALKVQITDQKGVLADQEFGQTTGGKDFERRLTLMFPANLQMMIRSLYKSDELQINQEFFNEFARRYPMFMVADKL
jgi:hypothetical protein